MSRSYGPLSADNSDLNQSRLQDCARGALRLANAEGIVPTPLFDVREALQLSQAPDFATLGQEMPLGLAARIGKALKKVRGFLAVREQLIYVDPALSHERERFTLGHELGHSLPWQKPAYTVDDDDSLSPQVKDRFEREANAYSAELLFNLDTFTDTASDSALSLAVPLGLAAAYGVSVHAAIRRYVETNPRPCALLVVGRYQVNPQGRPGVKVLYGLQSPTFREQYGNIVNCLPSLHISRSEHPWAEAAWQGIHGLPAEPVVTGSVAALWKLGNLDYSVTATPLNAFVLLHRPVRRLGQRPVRALWVPASAA